MIAVVNRAFHQVRQELAEVGLLADGRYLDFVDLYVASQPSSRVAGYVYEAPPSWGPQRFRVGAIYLPSNLPRHPRTPGYTLADTIRHEFAHTWYCLDPEFFRETWFLMAFGAAYSNSNPKPLSMWKRRLGRDSDYRAALARCRTHRGRRRVYSRHFRHQFITDYAAHCASEDFAETLMFFLKYRNSLDRYRNRPQVWRKLGAVERAIDRARRRARSLTAPRWTDVG